MQRPSDTDPMTEDEPDTGHNDWADEDPIPLVQKVFIPDFPIDALPQPIADMVNTTSEATQTDPAMAATSALSVLSACTGGHAKIEIRGGWQEPLNLYTAAIAAPGERKSAVLSALTRPLRVVEKELIEDGAGERREAWLRKKAAEDASTDLMHQLRKHEQLSEEWTKLMADAVGAHEMADAIDVPPLPRILADDVTPEAASSLLYEQKGRLAIISAEGGIFDIIAGRYSGNIPNLDVWLKGHAGDELRIDRKGREPEHIPYPALTLGLMIQPDVLRTIAKHQHFRGRGLLARFLYAYPVSNVGRRKIAAPTPDQQIIQAYEDRVKELAATLSGWVNDPAVLTLTAPAHEGFIAIETAVEPTLLPGVGELSSLADWGSKYCGAIARIAGIIHLTEHGPERGPRVSVTAETVLAAHRIGQYYRACAINAFGEMGSDQVTADAVYLWDRIGGLDADEVSERDLHVATKARFKKKADLLPALERLVEHGYLLPIETASTGERGRPASPRYRVHPHGTERTKTTET